ncbi:uncharacterized protein LOC126799218 [Argentina anserina]|uniref:uncharacterized protein LOC126799218 n=1 Tax=Argentina anserina TaxID=57926 RepID=UPI0021763D6C|nr:uncharacterized protein LOC126799218 [Potentilla anserina]
MGGLVLETASQISKFVMISMKTCYKSVGNHPFVVGILLFFIFLHRSFPVLFSVLVSTSPVLVCTAVLLGTLLSFGQSNIPEIEPHVDVAPLRTWVSGDDTVLVESGGSFPAEKLSATSRDIVDDESTTDYRVNGEAGDHDIYAPLIIENVQHQTESDNRVIEDLDRDIELPNDVEAAEQQYSLLQQVRDQILQVQDGNGNVSPQGGRNHYDDSGEASDSGSDGAESSSPDASMADILPVLDELHPLLDLEAPQPAHMSNDGSDAASDSSVESDGDNEEQGGRADEEDGVDYHGGDEEEVPEHSGKEDESKSAIKWTDDDQKNLMDLGNLELERNRRLENLIARRRTRKSFKLMAEKNLIDFGGVDLPFNVSPISTTRRNPFDSPFDDSYGDMGLPPIPGSAPSIMLARRNPFDLPYDSNEEKPDLKGDHFEQEFIASHANDAFFRRHESFSLGASSLGGAKHERQDFKWKPVFVPERLASEGPGYSLFQRQSSEVSESKLSSVHDSDSLSSAADLDDRKFSEQDFTTEAEVISNIYHVSGLVNHGSHSYEDAYSLEMEQVDKRDVLPDQLDIELGASEKLEPSLSDNGGLRTLTNELHLNPELVEEEDSSSSSSLSSLSEADEKISDVRDVGKILELSGDLVKEYLISAQHSLEESDIQFISTSVDDNQLKEPVYDSVPLEAENLISLNSISSDMQAEIYELVRTQSLAEMHVPFVYKDNDVDCENIEKATSANGDVCGATSKAHGADAIEGDLGNYNQAQLTSSLSEVEDGLPRNLEVNAVSSQSRCHYLLSNEQTSEQEKDLSWLDKSMVEPCLDDHMDALIIKDNVTEEVDDIKEIDPELLLELDTVGDFSVKDGIGEPLHYELVREVANAVSSESGLSTAELNLSEPNQELPILDHIHEGVDIDEAFKELHAGVNAEEVMFPGVVDNEQVSESTVQTSSQLLTTKATSLEDIITSSNQAPDNSANEFSQLLDTEGSVELRAVLPLEGNDVSADALPHVVEDIALYSIGSTDQETFTTQIHLKQLSEENVTKLLDTLDSEDVLAEVGAEAVVETVLSNDVFGVKETITDFPLKQVSEADVAELINPLNSNDETSEVGTAAVVETVSSNVSYGVEETIPDSPLKQLSDGTVAELPNPSNSKNETSEVGTEAVVQTVSSNVLHGVEETIPDSPLKLVSEDAVCELQKPLNLKDGCEEVTTVAVVETVSSNVSHGIEETIPDSHLKQLSDGTVAELPNPSNSKNETSEVGTEAVVQTVSSNVLHGVEETIPDSPLKLVSEDAVCELQKPLNLKDGCEEVTTTVGDSVEEIGSNNTGSDVPKTVPTPSALKEVSESFVVETIEMASDDRELVQEPVPTQVSEKNVGVGELPKPSNSNDGLTE